MLDQIRQHIKKTQDACLHRQGCFGSAHSALTSIVWHYYNDHVWRGLCTGCQRTFVPDDPDYDKWFNTVSGNLPSTSTVPPNWPPCVMGVPERPRTEMDAVLDELSDSEVKNLFSKTVRLAKSLKSEKPKPQRKSTKKKPAKKTRKKK